jgi:1-pyrroline-5-carboxylate dehydrogenase
MPERKKITYTSLLADESIHSRYEEALEAIAAKFGHRHPMFIGERGIFSNVEFEVRSPIDTDILIGYFQKGHEDDAKKAIEEAKKAQPDWMKKDWKERVRIFRNAAEHLEDKMFLLAALITYEAGKNRYEAIAEVSEAIDFLRYYCDVYEQHEGFVTPMTSSDPREKCLSMMRPHGLWAVISPFNFPIALAANMASAALLTGNTVVFKPTSVAPFSGLKLYQILIQSGVPPGVLNIVTGPGGPFGDVIVGHPDVDGIAFTGSREVGMWLHREFTARQPYPRPVVSEMGSKNPTIVTASADLQAAVEGVTRAAFGYGGQKCSATSRVYVQEEVASKFIFALKARVEALKVGDPREKDVFIGPVINEPALATYMDAVHMAKNDIKNGGSIITGGKILDDGALARGFYATPTVVTGIPRGHRLFTDELFVPFLVVDTFTTLEEALHQANNTEYGLTAGIFSENTREISDFFDAIQFGVTYANRDGGSTTGAWPGAQPFGGWKGSGSTGRGVGGPYYLLSYMREQARTRL